MTNTFEHEHPIVQEFYDVWQAARDPDDYIPVGGWTDRSRMKELLKGKANAAAVIHQWFLDLSDENQMAIVHASTYDSVLFRNLSFYFSDVHKTYRKLIS